MVLTRSGAPPVPTDGLTYTRAGSGSSARARQPLTLGTSARYGALTTPHWSGGDATLSALSVSP